MKNSFNDCDQRYPWAINSLKKIASNTLNNVFDIGAGKAPIKEQIKSLGMNYYGFDLVPNDSVKEWNIETKFPYQEKADVVIMLEVVEHLNNPWTGIKNIANVLRHGGYLIMSTPNPSWSDSRLSLMKKGVLTMFTKEDLELNHHVFTPWKHIIYKLLQQNGFEICLYESIGDKTNLTARPFWGWKFPLRFFYRAVKILLEKRDTDSIGALYGIVAKKIA